MFVSFVFIMASYWPAWNDEGLLNSGLLPQVFGKTIHGHIFTDIANRFDTKIWIAVFDGCLIANLIIKFPTENRIKEMKANKTSAIIESRFYIWLYTGSVLFFILPSLLVYIKALL